MPAYFALGFIALVAIVSCLRWLSRVDPKALATVMRYIAIALALVGVGLLILGGRLGLLLMLASLGYPLWQRLRARRQAAGIGQRQGHSSSVDTAYLSVSLDHDTGSVDGRVKAGRFKDRRLGELSLPELVLLLEEIRREDSEAVAVLEAYLDRIHGPEWRTQGDAKSSETRTTRGSMSREEAYAILGLSPGAGEEQIREAHRRLMLKLHPDHGGSDYLAARLNEARDALLGG
jgi:DnaJ domain